MSLVSKPLQTQKKLCKNKKNLPKKSSSVILGGPKKNLLTENTASLQTSRCNSCINLDQKAKNIVKVNTVPLQQNFQSIPVQIQRSQSIQSINSLTQKHNNMQLNKIINHKLNLAAVQPHQLFTNVFTLKD